MSIGQVRPYIYISDCGSAQTRSILRDRNIRRIVSVTNRESSLPSYELCQELGIATKVFRIMDTAFVDEEEVLVKDFFPWVREAEESGEAVIVHCVAGISRSPSFVVAYLVWRGMTFKDAWKLVKEKHPDAGPWLNTMESFLKCVGSSVPEEHIDRSEDPLARVK
ncbi:MAG: dual specificity protein phosphatase [Candidatus Spechtbacterales bacterium]